MERTADQNLEVDLLGQIANGDRIAFEELYRRYSGILYTGALRVLNDQREAEDILQEVFIQIWEKAHLYIADRGKPLTWALTLTRNKSIDRMRSLQRRARLRDDVETETEVSNSVELRNSTDEVVTRETGQMIRDAVMQLSHEQREAIEMAYFKGLTQNEIASRLDQPLGTVKARIRRGMMRLKDLVGKQI